MFAGEVEDHGDLLHGERCLIASEEVALDVVGKIERTCHAAVFFLVDPSKVRTARITTNAELVVHATTDHIGVYHCNALVQWQQRITSIGLGAEQPLFFATEMDEQHAALGFDP